MANVYNPRIAKLLELESSGRIKPEHQAELNALRAQGIVETDTPSQGPDVSQATRAQAIGKLAGLSVMEGALNRAESLYNTNFKKPGLRNQLREYLPTSEGAQLDKAIDLLRPLTTPVFRVPGEGAGNIKDDIKFEAPLPSRYSRDTANDESFKGLRNIIDQNRKQWAPVAGQIAPGTTIVNPETGVRMIWKGNKWQRTN